MSDLHTMRHRDDMERTGNWFLVRRSLGLAAFGMNMVEIPAGEQIPVHDETERDQEEVFVVLEGDAEVLIDDVAHPAPPGTFIRMDPPAVRTVRNPGGEAVLLLIASAPRGSGYEPPDWA